MTEAGENFLKRLGYERPEINRCEELIRAFCDEVEKRAEGFPDRLFSAAMDEVKKELFGENK